MKGQILLISSFSLMMTFTVACANNDADPTQVVTPVPKVHNVSMVALLANPEDFDGKRVRVSGLISLDFEDTRLYLGKEAYEHYSATDALDLSGLSQTDDILKIRSGDYVVIEGQFEEHTNFDGSPGVISDITRVVLAATRED